MTRTKSIYNVLQNKPQFSGRDIKDYQAMERIFNHYLNLHHDTMTREIAYYGRFEFFKNLVTYLDINFTNELHKRFYYRDITDEYAWRIVLMKTDKKMKFNTIY